MTDMTDQTQSTATRLQDIVDWRGERVCRGFKKIAPHITCADGTTLDVHASRHHHCTPRQNTGPYTEVQVGFPSAVPPESWNDYADADWATGSAYMYVPVSLVAQYIDSHGGISTPARQSK